MQELAGCIVTTAKSTDEILDNISKNTKRTLGEAHLSRDWRENKPIAIVGGGPSLRDTIGELSKYQFVMVCGSAHDYVMKYAGCPIDFCVLCDPDPLIISYLKEIRQGTKYFVASQCSPEIFDYLKFNDVKIWHAAGENVDQAVFGKDKVPIGGGCTIGTRAIILAMAFGFNNIHLYGFDTCLTEDNRHHAYEFNDPEKEKVSLGNISEVKLSVDGPTFKVAGYMLGQLFDFKTLLKNYSSRVRIEIFGDGLLKHLLDTAKLKAKELEASKEVI